MTWRPRRTARPAATSSAGTTPTPVSATDVLLARLFAPDQGAGVTASGIMLAQYMSRDVP
jgi:hypothetical protein